MAIESNSDRLMSEINVTPFVDVMLVLLIIFMVSAPMMVQGVDVSLPKAVSKSLPSDSEQLMVTVKSDSRVFINEYQVSIEGLQKKLAGILEGRQDRQVYFRADKSISYGTAVRVMSEIKAAGVQKLGMVTEPLDSGQPPADSDQKSVNGEQKS